MNMLITEHASGCALVLPSQGALIFKESTVITCHSSSCCFECMQVSMWNLSSNWTIAASLRKSFEADLHSNWFNLEQQMQFIYTSDSKRFLSFSKSRKETGMPLISERRRLHAWIQLQHSVWEDITESDYLGIIEQKNSYCYILSDS